MNKVLLDIVDYLFLELPDSLIHKYNLFDYEVPEKNCIELVGEKKGLLIYFDNDFKIEGFYEWDYERGTMELIYDCKTNKVYNQQLYKYWKKLIKKIRKLLNNYFGNKKKSELNNIVIEINIK
jgi:hypothetical protein